MKSGLIKCILAIWFLVNLSPPSHASGSLLSLAFHDEETGPAQVFAGNPRSVLDQTSVLTDSQQIFLPLIAGGVLAWPTVAANPQRTSWTSEEVRGRLQPLWFRPIEPYIPQKVQVIAAHGLLYISTARGLYALDADTGEIAWVYATEMPLGHSPTIDHGVAYVGGFDHKLHAIDAIAGPGSNNEPLWIFEAAAGFETNPLVVNGIVYAGNRDGFMYAVYANDHPDRGTLAWKFKTDGPILFSAAYQDDTVYFASNDAHAYALDATDGSLVWKSDKLPGSGFHSWWPVVYEDWIVIAGSENYRTSLYPGPLTHLHTLDIPELYADLAYGELVGPRGPDGLVDATRILDYYERKPWRRTYFVLDRQTGEEETYDFDSDGQVEYAPITWFGTKGAGNRYPPMVGPDGMLYQSMHYVADEYIPWGSVVGWKPGMSSFSTPESWLNAVDEPMGYSGGGRVIYWSRCCDRVLQAVDVVSGALWVYYSYDLPSRAPGYNVLYDPVVYRGAQGSVNGIYGHHGDQNPPVPYRGKVYIHRSNSIIAFAAHTGAPTGLPMAPIVPTQNANITPALTDYLKQRLSVEVQKILDAGHLRPGYLSSGLFNLTARQTDDLLDYWHYPADSLYALLLTLPHLPAGQQEDVRTYLQEEYVTYPPHVYTHIGWKDGMGREAFQLPPEVDADRVNFPPTRRWDGYYDGWTFPPHMFYALWKYAEALGGAQDVFENSRSRLEPIPADDYLMENPQVHNAYIAGYLGYLQLEALAGYPESGDVRAELDRLLALRAATFDKDVPWTGVEYKRPLSVARNFIYLVPELGQYLHDNALENVQEAIEEYNYVAPYWFVARNEEGFREFVINPLYDYSALFQAKALILQEDRDELLKYLDVPAFERGDLFYIQNLVAAIESLRDLDKVATPAVGIQGDSITYTLSFFGYTGDLSLTDTLPVGVSAPVVLTPGGTIVIPTPSYDSIAHHLTWSDTLSTGQQVTMRYYVTITTDIPGVLVNTLELSEAGGITNTTIARVSANPLQVYLPLIIKEDQ